MKAGTVVSPDIISPMFHITRCLAADAFCNVARFEGCGKKHGRGALAPDGRKRGDLHSTRGATASNAVRKINIEALIG